VAAVHRHTEHKLHAALFHADKPTRQLAMDALQAEIVDAIGAEYPKGEVLEAFDKEVRKLLRSSVLEHGKRVSGRGVNELRPISCEVGLLPRTHAPALFNRGLTQVLCITTLGSLRQEQQLDGSESKKRNALCIIIICRLSPPRSQNAPAPGTA